MFSQCFVSLNGSVPLPGQIGISAADGRPALAVHIMEPDTEQTTIRILADPDFAEITERAAHAWRLAKLRRTPTEPQDPATVPAEFRGQFESSGIFAFRGLTPTRDLLFCLAVDNAERPENPIHVIVQVPAFGAGSLINGMFQLELFFSAGAHLRDQQKRRRQNCRPAFG